MSGSKPGARSEKFNKANRVRALKHGQRAKVLSEPEIRKALLGKMHPDAAEILDGVFASAARSGDLTGVNEVGARALVETELLRRASVLKIATDGVAVKDQMVSRDGTVYGHRLKAHPLLELVVKMAQQLGFTAEEMQLTAKARGQGQKDAAMTAVLERMAKLRSADKSRMLPPGAPAIDVTPVR